MMMSIPIFPAFFYFVDIGHAAVDGNHQSNPLLAEFFQRGDGQAMTFRLAVGYVGYSFTTNEAQALYQRGGSGDAVGIEVSVDTDGLPPEQRLVYPDYGPVHVWKQPGVGQEAGVAGEKRFVVLRPGDAAVMEELYQQGGKNRNRRI
jgi:hypothetical protein